MTNENRESEDFVEALGTMIATTRYTYLLKIIKSSIDNAEWVKEIDKKFTEIRLSKDDIVQDSDSLELNKMSCLWLMTLTGGEINKESAEEIIKKQQECYNRYIQEVNKYVMESPKDYSHLMKRKSKTLEEMQKLYNQAEAIGLEVEGPILTKPIFSAFQTTIRNVHELATTMLLVNEKQEEFVRENLPQEMFLDTMDEIVKATMSDNKEDQEKATSRFETLKKYIEQALESTDRSEQSVGKGNKIKMLVSLPENAGE